MNSARITLILNATKSEKTYVLGHIVMFTINLHQKYNIGTLSTSNISPIHSLKETPRLCELHGRKSILEHNLRQ